MNWAVVILAQAVPDNDNAAYRIGEFLGELFGSLIGSLIGVGLVAFVSWVFNRPKKKAASLSGAAADTPSARLEAALKKYHKGMRRLGGSLIVLASLHIALGILLLSLKAKPLVLAV